MELKSTIMSAWETSYSVIKWIEITLENVSFLMFSSNLSFPLNDDDPKARNRWFPDTQNPESAVRFGKQRFPVVGFSLFAIR